MRTATGTGSEANPERPGVPGAGLPAPESRARRTVVCGGAVLALAVSVVYLTWRAGFTLGTDLWISVPLWLLELYAVVGIGLFTFSLWDLDSVKPPSEVHETDLRIAVLIPTYNEPSEVLLPTIAAAVALEPAHETWVLDDGQRSWVAELADTLGAHYLVREDHAHAKAGNVNHALGHIEADLVAILDADHVATPGFLTHTIGYFDDPHMAVVQTPQDFYNADSFEHDRNRSWFWRGRRDVSFNEQRLFYRGIQPGKNRWGAAFWCGTNAVVRMTALREVGGVAHESVTEDIHTTIRIHRKGWRTVYHNEVLAYGLAARDAEQYQTQRVRWGTGAMQVMHQEHPLTGPGLTFSQRLAYASTLLGWFDAWRTLGYVLVPMAVVFSGANPIHAPAVVFLVAFGITFTLQRIAIGLLSRGYAPQGLAMLFEFVRMQSNITATLTYLRRGERPFKVTAKAGSDGRSRQPVPRLLVGLILLTAAATIWFGATVAGLTPIHYGVRWTAYGAVFWMMFNACMLVGAASRIRSERFASDRRSSVRMTSGGSARLDGTVSELLDLSVGGALVRAHGAPTEDGLHQLQVRMGEATIDLDCVERSRQPVGAGGALIGLQFTSGQDREIAELAVRLIGGSRAPRPLTRQSAA
jgi:cellulose synthase/poly-beta-1,6-N-acetylglucosamine synthase-like glycosyltransferase